MAITVRLRETSGLIEVAQALIRLIRQLGSGAEARLLTNQAIGTSETPIAHGLGRTIGAPRAVFVTPYADARVWRTKAPDSERLYLAASAAVSADLLVVP